MLKCILSVLITLAAATSFAQDVMRQRSTTEGLGIHLFGQLSSWATTSEDYSVLSDNSSGGGLGIRLGYGITQRLEPYLRADYTMLTNSTYTDMRTNLTHLDLGLRFNFGSTIQRFRPFAELAGSHVRAVIDPLPVGSNDLRLGMQGYGLTGGLGFNLFLTPALAINAEYASVLIGKFSKTVDLGYSGGSTVQTELPGGGLVIGTGRLSIGLAYYLSGRR